MCWTIVRQAQRRWDHARLFRLAEISILESLQTSSTSSLCSYQQYPIYKSSQIAPSSHRPNRFLSLCHSSLFSAQTFAPSTNHNNDPLHIISRHIHQLYQQQHQQQQNTSSPTSPPSRPAHHLPSLHAYAYHTNTSTKSTISQPTNNNNRIPSHTLDNGWSYSEVFNLPNSLSLARLISGPIIGLLILDNNWSIAVPTLAVSGLTDWLDGYFARRTQQHTVLGTYLDPLADKVLIGSVVASLGIKGALPLPLVGVIVGRDVLLVVGAFFMRAKSLGWAWPGFKEFFRIAPPSIQSISLDSTVKEAKEEKKSPSTSVAPGIKPLFISKVNTVFQLSLISSCMLDAWIAWPGQDIVWSIGAMTAGTTIWSSVAYYIAYSRGQLGSNNENDLQEKM